MFQTGRSPSGGNGKKQYKRGAVFAYFETELPLTVHNGD
jgi:hypothetical protein